MITIITIFSYSIANITITMEVMDSKICELRIWPGMNEERSMIAEYR